VYITICNHILPILKMVKLRNVSAEVMYSYIDRDQASSDKPLPGIKLTALPICIFSSVQFSCSVVSDSFETPWTAAYQASLSITNCQSLLKLISIESVMPSNHLILCRPLLLPPSIFPSIRVFSNESVLCIRRPKYWTFSFNISPSSEYSGLISFTMDWLDLLAVQGTLKESSPTPQFKINWVPICLV